MTSTPAPSFSQSPPESSPQNFKQSPGTPQNVANGTNGTINPMTMNPETLNPGQTISLSNNTANNNTPSLTVLAGSSPAGTPTNLLSHSRSHSQSHPTPVPSSQRSGTPSAVLTTTTLSNHNKRINVDSIMLHFQKVLGTKWDAYRDVVTHFLLGKLTRMELQSELDTILTDPTMVQMHNQFLLANLTNAMREPPPGEAGFMLGSWSRKSKDAMRLVRGDSQLAKLKQDILSLPIRERKRIKAIAKDTSKRPTIPSAIMTTRQAILPKIPFVNTNQQSQAMGSPATGTGPLGGTPPGQQNQQKQQPNGSTPNRATPPPSAGATNAPPPPPVANPAVWAQDIVHGYEAPLASETYEIPDADSLKARMLGISLEHGLLRGVDTSSTEIMQVGLELYLKGLVEQLFLRVKGRTNDKSKNNINQPLTADSDPLHAPITSGVSNAYPNNHSSQPQKLTIQDVAFMAENAPHCLVEAPGPLYRLKSVMLQNDDMQDKLPPAQPHIGPPEAVQFLNELLAE